MEETGQIQSAVSTCQFLLPGRTLYAATQLQLHQERSTVVRSNRKAWKRLAQGTPAIDFFLLLLFLNRSAHFHFMVQFLFLFLFCYAATQLAIQLHQERIQVVRSNREARKRPTESNGTPAMDLKNRNRCLFLICVPWRTHMCAMTHSYVCHDAFICVPWRIHMC